MTRIVIDHLARVEGHGGVTIELSDHGVDSVQFDITEGARLLEGILRGRSYDEVAPITSRICAICSAAHTLASLTATEHAFGVVPSGQTERLRDLLLRGENIESHALHVFFLALPDYLGAPSAIALAAEHRDAVTLALRLKQLGNAIQEVVAGRAIHPVTAVVGGFTSPPSPDDLLALRERLLQARTDIEVAVELVSALPAVDIGRSATAYAALRATRGYDYAGGHEIVIDASGRSVSVPLTAYRSITRERTVAHSHAKHSRWNGTPFMVGAVARLAINGEHLPSVGERAVQRLGLPPRSDDPQDNTRAQVVELAVDVERALSLVEELLAEGLSVEPPAAVTPRAATGTGVIEAPRGLLVHSYHYDEQGRIAEADIITPTALNAASVEHRLRHALEQLDDQDADGVRRRAEMLVRAYDPCISCSVHVLDARHAP